MTMKGYSHSPKFHYCSLTIRLFSVIHRMLVNKVFFLPLCRDAVSVFNSPSWLGWILGIFPISIESELTWSHFIVMGMHKMKFLLCHLEINACSLWHFPSGAPLHFFSRSLSITKKKTHENWKEAFYNRVCVTFYLWFDLLWFYGTSSILGHKFQIHFIHINSSIPSNSVWQKFLDSISNNSAQHKFSSIWPIDKTLSVPEWT